MGEASETKELMREMMPIFEDICDWPAKVEEFREQTGVLGPEQEIVIESMKAAAFAGFVSGICHSEEAFLRARRAHKAKP